MILQLHRAAEPSCWHYQKPHWSINNHRPNTTAVLSLSESRQLWRISLIQSARRSSSWLSSGGEDLEEPEIDVKQKMQRGEHICDNPSWFPTAFTNKHICECIWRETLTRLRSWKMFILLMPSIHQGLKLTQKTKTHLKGLASWEAYLSEEIQKCVVCEVCVSCFSTSIFPCFHRQSTSDAKVWRHDEKLFTLFALSLSLLH